MNRDEQLFKLRELISAWPSFPEQCGGYKDVEFFWTEGYRDITLKSPNTCILSGLENSIEFSKNDIFPAHAVLQPSAGDQWRNCPSSVVVERDFRLPEFRDANPEDYERDEHGKIVRKDRFKKGFDQLFDLLELKCDNRTIETVVAHFDDLRDTEDLFSAVVNLVGVSEPRFVVDQVRKLTNLQRALRNNARMDAAEMAEHIELTEASLVQDWTIEDFTSIGWDMGLMVVHGFAKFKKVGVAPTPMPNTPRFKNAPYAPSPSFLNSQYPTTKA